MPQQVSSKPDWTNPDRLLCSRNARRLGNAAARRCEGGWVRTGNRSRRGRVSLGEAGVGRVEIDARSERQSGLAHGKDGETERHKVGTS
jgi:hypothetical protein